MSLFITEVGEGSKKEPRTNIW